MISGRCNNGTGIIIDKMIIITVLLWEVIAHLSLREHMIVTAMGPNWWDNDLYLMTGH